MPQPPNRVIIGALKVMFVILNVMVTLQLTTRGIDNKYLRHYHLGDQWRQVFTTKVILGIVVMSSAVNNLVSVSAAVSELRSLVLFNCFYNFLVSVISMSLVVFMMAVAITFVAVHLCFMIKIKKQDELTRRFPFDAGSPSSQEAHSVVFESGISDRPGQVLLTIHPKRYNSSRSHLPLFVELPLPNNHQREVCRQLNGANNDHQMIEATDSPPKYDDVVNARNDIVVTGLWI